MQGKGFWLVYGAVVVAVGMVAVGGAVVVADGMVEVGLGLGLCGWFSLVWVGQVSEKDERVIGW